MTRSCEQLARQPDGTHKPVERPHGLHYLMVGTHSCGFGLGEAQSRRVIEQACDRAGLSRGTADLLLSVYANNAPSIALYRKLGSEPATVPFMEARFEAAAREGQWRMMATRRLLA